MKRIKQILDSPITGRINHAFATVEMDLQTEEGPVTIELDIESAITLLNRMDHGSEAVDKLRASRVSEPTHKYLDRITWAAWGGFAFAVAELIWKYI